MSKISIPTSNISFFQNVVIDRFEMTFDLYNHSKIPVAFANAIRRILMSELKMITISKKFIHFIRNTTMLNDSMLANRLTLIPLNEEWINKQSFPMNELEIRYHKQNRGEMIQSVYVEDFEVCHIHPESLERRVIRNHELFPRPRILFAKMKPGQELHFTSLLDNKSCVEEGAIKSQTCSAIFTYKKDEEAIQRHITENGLTGTDLEDFMYLESAKKYLMNDEMEPMVYQFLIESIGVYTPDKLMEKALDRFQEKLVYYLPMSEDRITVDQSKTSFMAFDFTMENEDDTLGNIISYMLGKKEEVAYSGYAKEHPLIKKLIIRFSLSGEEEEGINLKEKHVGKMRSIIQEIVDLIVELKEQWRNVSKKQQKIELSAPTYTQATVESVPIPVPSVSVVKEEIPVPIEEIPEEPKKKKVIRRKTKKTSSD